MKIKLSEIVNISLPDEKSKKTVFDLLFEVKFPVKISFRLKRLISKLQPELTTYDEKRNELVKEYGDKPDTEGNIKVTDPEKLTIFYSKLAELLSLEVEIDWEPLKIEELGNVEIESKLLNNFIFE